MFEVFLLSMVGFSVAGLTISIVWTAMKHIRVNKHPVMPDSYDHLVSRGRIRGRHNTGI